VSLFTGTVSRVKTLTCCILHFFFILLLSYGRYVGWGEGPKDTHQGGTKPETYDNRKLVLTCLLNYAAGTVND
jgi:hypothetical protein